MILLVGGSGGIGQALRQEFALDGCTVVSSKELDITNNAYTCGYLWDNPHRTVVNLAGVSLDKTILTAHPEDIRKQVEVNAIGNINLIQAFINSRTETTGENLGGQYIYISSILSTKSVRGAGVYAATKAFSDSIIRTAALENVRRGLTFNSIQLGYFGKGMCERLPEEIKNNVLKDIPLKRFGEAWELANLIRFFMETPYATGMNVPLTGGYGIGT